MMMARPCILFLLLTLFGHAFSVAQQSAARPLIRHPYVFVHGATGGSWAWRVMDSLMTPRGHRVVRPSLTGLGERVHLASPNIGLTTHIDDVVNAILWENLHDVILVGHSYSGVVIAGVADRIPERIRHLVYLDAYLPDSGETALELAESIGATRLRQNARGGFIMPGAGGDHTIPRDVPHPLRTFTDTLRLTNPAARKLPATYILTYQRGKEPDAFERFAERARVRGYKVVRLEADHVPQRTAPIALMHLLEGIR
jgi:pimeloyl-ACP methyl ester carboxylesterase